MKKERHFRSKHHNLQLHHQLLGKQICKITNTCQSLGKCLFKICILIFLFTTWTIDCSRTWKVKEIYLVWPKKANSHSGKYYYAMVINHLLLWKLSYPCICILFQPFKKIQLHLSVEGQEFLFCNTIQQCCIRNRELISFEPIIIVHKT